MKNKKTSVFLIVLFIFSLAGIYAFTPNYEYETVYSGKFESVSDSTDKKIYTCPMHPEVISEKPGKCPKCGMDLEIKEDGSKKDEKKDEGNNHKGHHGCMGH